MKRAVVLGVTMLLLTFPVQGARGQADPNLMGCKRGPEAGFAPFDSAGVLELAGEFQLILVDTTRSRGAIRTHRGVLTLWVQDSSRRFPSAAARPGRRLRGQAPLAGAFSAAPPDTGETWRRMGDKNPDSPGVIFDRGGLRFGDYGDPMGVNVIVQHVSPGEVRGSWTRNAGIGVTVDFTLARAPEEAGYFCARRGG